ncbi:MAG: phosphoribosylformylglycinamidine synthase [Oscillospiraceae bacterium]|jgi:phosphoribosylformylglycinamidine synthase|nr:phosphoribosylformylglycinamidine synthase [Oscillospiraceae bacterium]
MVYRVYTKKKPQFAEEAAGVLADIHTALKLDKVTAVGIINRYDVEGLSEELFDNAITSLFSEPPLDDIYRELPDLNSEERVFVSEFLPGQFDQRADSAAMCLAMLFGCDKPVVKYAKIYVISGEISDEEFDKIKSYLINSVESRECELSAVPDTLETTVEIPTSVETMNGFISLPKAWLEEIRKSYGLAMDIDDLLFCQEYFKSENRNPTITELRLLDTYWSDHCRHTTFGTILDDIEILPAYIKETFDDYKAHRNVAKPVCLMDIATAGVKRLKAEGKIPDLDESEEINACSIKVKADIDGKPVDYILMFKNETHNHPTEIEPFGGAATCLGGAIRDPLSGRSYVYQAMRVTGGSDPRLPVADTLPGKLPPRKITTTAAAGYSSYGNQIGLATGHVSEVFDPGYMAKRLEIGAVLGAAPAENIVREEPIAGDLVILLGGKTGRDGCGGATGSSKAHTADSLSDCGAEVQKGNAPEERKLQRLFRKKAAARLIKRCNDFGAGGVAVAVGELADGLVIDLNAVTKKYEGLDGTELAISESQERMAVVVAQHNVRQFVEMARAENLETAMIAMITPESRLRMQWNNEAIVDIDRKFLSSNGAEKHANVKVEAPVVSYKKEYESLEQLVTDINIASQRGLVQRFDSTVGRAGVSLPFGGKYQQTPSQSMAARLPSDKGESHTASIMAWGFDPFVSKQSPYHGAVAAVVESVAKIVAAGGKHEAVRLTFQEYFGRVSEKYSTPERWGKPFAALLGAYKAQIALGLPALGGKDSMSGTFGELDVPPTLVSFAVVTTPCDKVISSELKQSGDIISVIKPRYDGDNLPDFDDLHRVFDIVEREIESGNAVSVRAIEKGGEAEAVFKMTLGNRIGVKLNRELTADLCYGGFVIESTDEVTETERIGETIDEYQLVFEQKTYDIADLEAKYDSVLEGIFRQQTGDNGSAKTITDIRDYKPRSPAIKVAKPTVLIPVFPGTNGEYDMAAAFEKAGANTEQFVIRNLSPIDVSDSIKLFAKAAAKAQMIALSGGFSAGDEPEGSGKFIKAFFLAAAVREAVTALLDEREGLMLGICNGFQALIKLGLLPYGKITGQTAESPTLTFNKIGRHQSQMVDTRLCTVNSPWLTKCRVGEVFTVPISHGEGRFVATDEVLLSLEQNGQILSQYVDFDGVPSLDTRFNPNGSDLAIEGLLSPDGRIIGKMGHSERVHGGLALNVPGNKDMPLFEAGVRYFA